MQKTPFRNPTLKRLAELNDQFNFYRFAKQQLILKLGEFSPNAGSMYTTDVFANNNLSERIRIRIKEMPRMYKDNASVTSGAYYSYFYEIVSNFIVDIIILMNDVHNTNISIDRIRRGRIEEKYRHGLAQIGVNLPDELVKTYTYSRLRRNHFVHGARSLSAEFNSFIANSGVCINRYWHRRANTSVIDFTNKNITDFTEDETIDLMNILRRLANSFDKALASTFQGPDILKYIADREYGTEARATNSDVIAKRTTRISNIIKMEFDMVLKKEDVRKAVIKAYKHD